MSANVNEDAQPLDEDVLTALVVAVHGVSDVFPPALSLAQVSYMLTAVVTGDPERLDRVHVSSAGGTTTVAVRLGTSIDAATPNTAKQVADVLLAQIPDGLDATVTVQVSRIA
ncbi:hypothetical protein [Cryobacterium sp. PH31-L1]|uniref:hypothetical protein n=1 Tax=Cryobacterium sp. PH31-L1 TaxID=3046199 RepID=UPI0024BA639F|nr:hypothetical protein [Cryobacterium sp. PH31-L1]MDJ0379051.1 hypothetical protein [Cryobacterium sp. PH31-L1]